MNCVLVFGVVGSRFCLIVFMFVVGSGGNLLLCI